MKLRNGKNYCYQCAYYYGRCDSCFIEWVGTLRQ